MDLLSDDILTYLFLFFPIKDLFHICITSKHFLRLWNEESIWKSRYLMDFGCFEKSIKNSWKQAYINKTKLNIIKGYYKFSNDDIAKYYCDKRPGIYYHLIEKNTINKICDLVKKQLIKDINCKIIIHIKSPLAIKEIDIKLKQYDPFILKTTSKTNNLMRFKEKLIPRILIINNHLMKLDITLEDIIGNQPRFIFLCPVVSDFYLKQLVSKFATNSKSNTIIQIVYNVNSDKDKDPLKLTYSSIIEK